MGEYVPTTIKLGGRVTAEQAAEILELVEQYQLVCDTDERTPTIADLDEKLYASEVNYGNLSDLTNWCSANGVSYQHWVDECGGESEDVRRLRFTASGATDLRHAPSSDGDPLLPYSKLLEIETLASAMGALIEEARWWNEPLVLEIVG